MLSLGNWAACFVQPRLPIRQVSSQIRQCSQQEVFQ